MTYSCSQLHSDYSSDQVEFLLLKLPQFQSFISSHSLSLPLQCHHIFGRQHHLANYRPNLILISPRAHAYGHDRYPQHLKLASILSQLLRSASATHPDFTATQHDHDSLAFNHAILSQLAHQPIANLIADAASLFNTTIPSHISLN